MTAAEVLMQAGTAALPVDLSAVAAAHDIKVVSYESCADYLGMSVQQLYEEISPLGFSFREGERCIAAINHNACGGLRRRWTMAHELAHIFLGHIGTDIKRMEERCERSADSFAAELLAPLTVLHFCGVSSAAETARLCGLSKQAAEIRFRQLQELRRKSSALYRQGKGTAFLQCESDRQLYERFLPFISEYITRRSAHDGYAEHLRHISMAWS